MKDKKNKKPDKKNDSQELIEHLQKLQAEFDNYRKRQETEKSQVLDLAKKSVLLELLPVLDNFDRASAHLPKAIENDPWAIGMQNVGKQLVDALINLGVKKFNSLGQKFDYHRHEAIGYEKSDKLEDIVIEEIAPGYEINGEVIRPAMVKVSKNNRK